MAEVNGEIDILWQFVQSFVYQICDLEEIAVIQRERNSHLIDLINLDIDLFWYFLNLFELVDQITGRIVDSLFGGSNDIKESGCAEKQQKKRHALGDGQKSKFCLVEDTSSELLFVSVQNQ